jgi:K+-sensing histidine kinase KdpD
VSIPQMPQILYGEENIQTVQLVQARLQQLGYAVEWANSSTALLKLLTTTQYHLLLLNPALLVDDALIQGWQTSNRPLTILLPSSHSDRRGVSRAFELGMAEHLLAGSLEDQLHLLPLLIERVVAKQQELLKSEQILSSLQQDNRNLTLLTRASQLFTSTLDMDEVISQLVQAITEIVITEGSSVWLWDGEDSGYLACVAMYLDGKNISSGQLRLPPGAGVVGWVANHAQTVNVSDAYSDPRFADNVDLKTGYTTKSILAVPLITRNQVIGVLELVNKREGYFDEREVELAETLAAYAANAIENARLMASVRRQRDLLERQNEALDAFAHSVAHDLKNPLTLIVGYADMLREDSASLSEVVVQESLNTIFEYGIKMSSIVDALLMLANVGFGEPIECEPVDMGLTVQAVFRRIEHMIREYEAEITAPDAWPTALGYSTWLEEVWYNYLSNGLKYGGRPPQLVLGYDELEEGKIRFWVQDNGPGLELENPLTLFQPQPRHQRRKSSQGHGLGLSIVQRIIDRLGGTVGVESKVGQGSRFSFTLPRAATTTNTA